PLEAHRQRRISTEYVVVPSGAGRGDPAYEIRAPDRVERDLAIENETQREQRLWRDTVVVVGIARAVQRPDAGVARAEHSRPLKRDRVGEPPLAGRAERQRGARDAKDLRRDVVVTAVEPPDAAIIRAELVVLGEKRSPRQDVF